MKYTLRDLDCCCSIVGLSYKGERRYKSPIGGFLTLILFFLSTFVLIFHLVIFFGRKRPKFIFKKEKFWDPPQLNLSDNFTIAISMGYNGVQAIREDVLKVDAYSFKKYEDKTKIFPIQSVPCRKEYFLEAQDIYDALNLEKAICFNLTGFSLQGTSINKNYEYIHIRFSLCNSKNKNCTTNIEDIFKDDFPVAYFYFLDTVFQTDDRKNAIRHFINHIDLNLTYLNTKITNIYFQKNALEIDESYFNIESPKVYEHYMIEGYRDIDSTRNERQEYVYAINLFSSTQKSVYRISYMKLSEVLASISGIFNIFWLLLTRIGDYVNNFYFQNDIIGSLYSLKNETQKMLVLRNNLTKGLTNYNERMRAKIDCPFPSIKITAPNGSYKIRYTKKISDCERTKVQNLNFSDIQLVNDSNINNSLRKTNNVFSHVKTSTIRKKGNGIILDREFSSKEIIVISVNSFFRPLLFLCKSSPTFQKYQAIKEKILLTHDMINMYQKIQEIDLLKYLLLSEKQLGLYKIIPKPVLFLENPVSYQDETNTFSKFYNDKDLHYLKTNQEIYEVFKSGNFEKENLFDLFYQENQTEMDQKLINILKERLFHKS